MSTMRLPKAARIALLLLWAMLAPSIGRGNEHPSCRPHPDAADRVLALAWGADECRPAEPCWQEKLEALRELRGQFPDDVHVHRTYQDAVRFTDAAAVAEEYEALLAEHPEDPLFLYLRARLWRGEKLTAAAEATLAADPGFPWAHLARLVAYLQESPPRPEAAFEHLQTFMKLCPASAPPGAHTPGPPSFCSIVR